MPRARKAKPRRQRRQRPRRGEIYKVGRRRVRIVGVTGLDPYGEFNGKYAPAATWESVSKNGDRRYGRDLREGWTMRRTWQGRTALQFIDGAWRMPPPYTREEA